MCQKSNYIVTTWTNECICSHGALWGLILILILMGRCLFLWKCFRIYVYIFFYVNYCQEYQTRTQLLPDSIYKKKPNDGGPLISEVSSWFLWPTNWFRKVLWKSYILRSFVMPFVVQYLRLPDQRSNCFLRRKSQPRHCFQLLSNASHDYAFICFKKMSYDFLNFSSKLSYSSQLQL